MPSVVLPLVFSIMIGIVHYFSNRFSLKRKRYYHKMLSFSGGISITYVLLELFPRFTELAFKIDRLLFLALLVGVIIHHLIEKEIYQHNSKHDLIKVLSLEENIFSFIYHIVLGIVLVLFTIPNVVQGVLFFIPILSFTFAKELPGRVHPHKRQLIFLASSTTIGVIIGAFWQTIPLWFSTLLIGFVTGVLLYTIIRHHIPFGRKGRVGYFTLGFFVYAILIVLSWFV